MSDIPAGPSPPSLSEHRHTDTRNLSCITVQKPTSRVTWTAMVGIFWSSLGVDSCLVAHGQCQGGRQGCLQMLSPMTYATRPTLPSWRWTKVATYKRSKSHGGHRIERACSCIVECMHACNAFFLALSLVQASAPHVLETSVRPLSSSLSWWTGFPSRCSSTQLSSRLLRSSEWGMYYMHCHSLDIKDRLLGFLFQCYFSLLFT